MIGLAACGETAVRTEYVPLEIPAPLLQPEIVEPREVVTVKDVGGLVVDQAEALDRANGKITSIACIQEAAKAKAAGEMEIDCAEGS